MKVAVVYNPVKVDETTLRHAVDAESAEGDEIVWLETSEEHPDAQIGDHLDGVELVLVAGGDGTVRLAAGALGHTGVPLGIVPAGTGNLLSRNISMDLLSSVRRAVHIAFHGKDRTIDLAYVDVQRPDGSRASRVFTVMAGFGLDAVTMDVTDASLKKRVGWLAYVDAGLRAFKVVKRVRATMRTDGKDVRRSMVHTFVVGNCGILTANLLLLPDAKLDDGKLDIAAIRPNDVFGWVQVLAFIGAHNSLWNRALRRTKLRSPTRSLSTLGYWQAKVLDVNLAEPRLLQIDGDVDGEAQKFRFRSDPGALIVRTPLSRLSETAQLIEDAAHKLSDVVKRP